MVVLTRSGKFSTGGLGVIPFQPRYGRSGDATATSVRYPLSAQLMGDASTASSLVTCQSIDHPRT